LRGKCFRGGRFLIWEKRGGCSWIFWGRTDARKETKKNNGGFTSRGREKKYLKINHGGVSGIEGKKERTVKKEEKGVEGKTLNEGKGKKITKDLSIGVKKKKTWSHFGTWEKTGKECLGSKGGNKGSTPCDLESGETSTGGEAGGVDPIFRAGGLLRSLFKGIKKNAVLEGNGKKVIGGGGQQPQRESTRR